MPTVTITYDENMPNEIHVLLTRINELLKEHNNNTVMLQWDGGHLAFDKRKLLITYHLYKYLKATGKVYNVEGTLVTCLKYLNFNGEETARYQTAIKLDKWKPES